MADAIEIMRLLDQLYAPEEAMLWMGSAQQLLQGRTPREAIKSGDSKAVLDLLQSISEGVYT